MKTLSVGDRTVMAAVAMTLVVQSCLVVYVLFFSDVFGALASKSLVGYGLVGGMWLYLWLVGLRLGYR